MTACLAPQHRRIAPGDLGLTMRVRPVRGGYYYNPVVLRAAPRKGDGAIMWTDVERDPGATYAVGAPRVELPESVLAREEANRLYAGVPDPTIAGPGRGSQIVAACLALARAKGWPYLVEPPLSKREVAWLWSFPAPKDRKQSAYQARQPVTCGICWHLSGELMLLEELRGGACRRIRRVRTYDVDTLLAEVPAGHFPAAVEALLRPADVWGMPLFEAGRASG